MRILRAADHRVMPWKNGGGTTTEIAAHPDGSDLAGFGWRVSMASVAADGPFSLFPGIDRTLAVLEGEGIHLAVDGQGVRRLTRASAPHPFPADAAASAALVAGPILDLNVMTRRGVHTHGVERRRIEDVVPICFTALWTLLLPRGPVRAEPVDGRAIGLDAGDALVAEHGEADIRLSAASLVDVFVVAIDPA